MSACECGLYPENVVIASTRRDFYRVASKYDLDHLQTWWSRPGGPVYGVRALRIIISATVLANPPDEFDRWVDLALMCRLAHDGELIKEDSHVAVAGPAAATEAA